jgi:hypothetical protein
LSDVPSARMVEAMKLVVAGLTPYAASKRVGIATNTMYRSRLYKLWKQAKPLEMVNKEDYNKLMLELSRELDVTRPVPRVKGKKKQRFTLKK